MTEVIFKKAKIPFTGSDYPIRESQLTTVQRAILALKPESDQCIEVGAFLEDKEIGNLLAPIKKKLVRIHGMWTDEFHLSRQTKVRECNWFNPSYPKYTVVRQSFDKRYEMGGGAIYKCRFYVRYSRFYAEAVAHGREIKDYEENA